MEGAVGHGQNDYKLTLGRNTVVRALMQAKAMPIPGRKA
jgi:xanthine dehydrogenase YagS FAD-binding subunit